MTTIADVAAPMISVAVEHFFPILAATTRDELVLNKHEEELRREAFLVNYENFDYVFHVTQNGADPVFLSTITGSTIDSEMERLADLTKKVRDWGRDSISPYVPVAVQRRIEEFAEYKPSRISRLILSSDLKTDGISDEELLSEKPKRNIHLRRAATLLKSILSDLSSANPDDESVRGVPSACLFQGSQEFQSVSDFYRRADKDAKEIFTILLGIAVRTHVNVVLRDYIYHIQH